MTVFLYGAYGTGNLGDDLLLKGAMLEHSDSDIEIVAYGKPFIDDVHNYIKYDSFIADPDFFLKKGDSLVFAGGGLFWAASHCDDMLHVATRAKKIGCDVYIKRIGAQGFNLNPEAVKSLMEKCSDISVRDMHSVQILKDHQITDRAYYLPDYVLTLNNYIKKFPKNRFGKIRIGINHSATLFYDDFEHRKKALHVYTHIANLYKDEVDFFYIPHTRHFRCIEQNDILYGEHFWVASGGLIQPIDFPTQSIDELLQIYATMDGVIGWRYHLLVLGSLFGCNLAFLGSLDGHKYGAFASENNISQINFDLTTNQIIKSFSRWIERVKQSRLEHI